MSTLVSVVMPAYNAAATIAVSIDSVLAQTHAPLELIVVNDGSTDRTLAIAESYAARDDRVCVIDQPNAGVSAARNRAIAQARGELLAFLDADDLWEPDKLAAQVAHLDGRPKVGLTYTALTLIDGQGGEIGDYGVKPEYRGRCLDRLMRSNALCQSSAMARTELVRAVGGYDESLSACEDWDLWIRLAERAELDHIDRPLTRYRFHPGNSTSDLDRLRDAHLSVLARCEARHGAAAHADEARYVAYRDYARRYLLRGEIAKGLRDVRLAFAARPLSPRTWWQLGKLLLYPVIGRRDANVDAQLGETA